MNVREHKHSYVHLLSTPLGFLPTTVQYHKHLISQLDGRKSMMT